MRTTTFLRSVPAVLALAAASFALGAHAQSGQAYPSKDVNTSANPAPTPNAVDRVENSRPVQATERGMKKAAKATKKAGHKTANAARRTGDKLSNKLPDRASSPNKGSPGASNVSN